MALRLPWSRKTPDAAAAAATVAPGDPLDAVPIVRDNVEVATDRGGLTQLRYVAPPRSGVRAFLSGRLKLVKALRVNLDERGTAFWRLIDGRRDLHVISRQIGEQFGLDRKQARDATIAFIRELMLRGMIQLKVHRRRNHNQ